MDVTIFLTVKNNSQTIGDCIESLLNQTYDNYKIYVVDAYSDDGTWEILKEYEEDIRLERREGNAPECFNYGFDKINTDLIALIDGDCTPKEDWLENLVGGFENEENVIVTAGFCKTPEDVNRLQRVIGLELENRFKNFPKYISRAPTMNFCIKTEYAKKVKMDESLGRAFETEWGYRLNEHGKIRYVPEAVIYHHHRTSLFDYFKQQYGYGKTAPSVYLQHPEKSGGDEISTGSMILQPFLFSLTLFSFLLSFLSDFLLFLGLASLILLFSIYLLDMINVGERMSDFPYLFLIFITRTVAWSAGGLSFLLFPGTYQSR